MAEKEKIKYDLDGYEAVTPALWELLNQYPRLSEGQEISFATLSEDKGIAMFPEAGAAIEREKEDITGTVTQVCLYPFFVVYRASGLNENRRANVKEWLDGLGKWLEGLRKYPTLTENRKMLSVTRQTPAALDNINENKAEDWVISLSLRYQNKFEKQE